MNFLMKKLLCTKNYFVPKILRILSEMRTFEPYFTIFAVLW